MTLAERAESTGHSIRLAVRQRRFNGPTAGAANGYLQANVTILPKVFADRFLRYCEANPKPCPVLGISEPGASSLPMLGEDLDVRTDVPRYLVFEHGVEVAQVSSLTSLWRNDLVTVALGCSFSFDHLLLAAGIPVLHVSRCANVSMWRTTVSTNAVGPFQGPLVVSMRPMPPTAIERAAQITGSVANAHGAPVYWGDPGGLGISDLSAPHYGDPVTLESGEVPVFWACGVTAQVAVQRAHLPFAITHAPGYMLLTDVTLGRSGR